MAFTTKRKPKFSNNELEVLVDGVSAKQNILFSKFTNTITNNSKNREWESIARKVNAVATCTREIGEIRGKWFDLSSRTKKKEASRRKELRKTGGGEHVKLLDLTPLEDKVVSILGDVAVDGIAGGIDTSVDGISGLSASGDAPTNTTATVSLSECEGTSHDANDPITDFEDRDEDTCMVVSEPVPSSQKKKTSSAYNTTEHTLIDIEKFRLKIEKKRLKIEKKKYKLLKQIYQLENDKFKLFESHMFNSTCNTNNIMDLDTGSVFEALSVAEHM